ncbi:hypothetical protein M404DRAFT_33002 [Pisolithus tinctorius Marx 270]|uniref:Uncharacterized protein n=1 Tax=Pisolithus tinctorius Marx 270 TaxID=870435 RepID=A0A0C3N6U4_PISTI|nr:hypothetical protein M404DRAFT_33002 [Pisolithus tinctorius Marx 270]
MSDSRPITTTDNNSEGQVMVDWTQVLDDAIKYDTNNEEETMRAKAKERKWCKAAKQAWWEEQAWLEAERVERERVEAKREEKEAEQKHKAKAEKGDEAGAGSSEAAGVEKVVMEPSCTHCTQAKTVCEFLMDGNKKQVTCIWCNQSKGKCQWPGDRKDTKTGPKATTKVDKGKKQKANEELPEPRPSKKKWAKSKSVEVLDIDKPKASGSGARKAGAGYFSGLEEKLEWLINTTGMIANNLASLYNLHKTTVNNSG